jgi:type I restriction enzyme S subunit
MKPWPEIPLAEIAKPISRTVEVIPGQNYRTIGVKWWGEGAYERETIDGSRTAAKTLSVVRLGDLIINKIWVRHGSTAIAGVEVDGCAASGEFPTFTLDENSVVPRWLHWQTKTRAFWAKCDALSRGTSGKNRIKPELFLTIRVPLPPLAEQRRVVARIEELAAQIHEARTLRHQAAEEAEALVASFRRAVFGESPQPDWIPLSTYVESIVNGKSPATEGRPAASNEWAVLKVGAVSFGVFDERENKALPLSYVVPRPMEVRPGDFIMSRANTVELVGACALVRKTRPKLMLSDKTFRFVFRQPRQALPEYMEQVLKSPPLREQIERGASGTSPTMKNISKEKVLALRLPPLPLPEQRRIVAELDALQAEVDGLKRLQAETAAELDALLPAILDKAFKGEL